MTNSLSSSAHTLTAGFTQLIKPAISNEVWANYSNHRIGIRWVMDDFGGAVPPPDSILFPAGASSASSLFGLFIAGVGQYNQGKQGTSEQRQLNFNDNLSLTEGSHQLKVGMDYAGLLRSAAHFPTGNSCYFRE